MKKIINKYISCISEKNFIDTIEIYTKKLNENIILSLNIEIINEGKLNNTKFINKKLRGISGLEYIVSLDIIINTKNLVNLNFINRINFPNLSMLYFTLNYPYMTHYNLSYINDMKLTKFTIINDISTYYDKNLYEENMLNFSNLKYKNNSYFMNISKLKIECLEELVLKTINKNDTKHINIIFPCNKLNKLKTLVLINSNIINKNFININNNIENFIYRSSNKILNNIVDEILILNKLKFLSVSIMKNSKKHGNIMDLSSMNFLKFIIIHDTHKINSKYVNIYKLNNIENIYTEINSDISIKICENIDYIKNVNINKTVDLQIENKKLIIENLKIL